MYASNIVEHSPITISSEALNQIGDESVIPSELSLIPDILYGDSDESEILPDSNEQSIVRETNRAEDAHVINEVQNITDVPHQAVLSTENTLFDIVTSE